MKVSRNAKWVILITSLFFLGACGGSGGSGTTASSDTGTLSLSMVDASDDSYQAVYVSIKEVQVCEQPLDCDKEGVAETRCECEEWKTIVTLNRTYDLLELVNGVTETLCEEESLPAGTYNQMRLILNGPDDVLENDDTELDLNPDYLPNYLIDLEGNPHEMKVPSGEESGIKLVSQFEIKENMETTLVLDFDVTRSIHKTGPNSDKSGKKSEPKYILRPTIRVIGTENRAVVSGIVASDDESPILLENALVSAYDDSQNFIASTSTDENGAYKLVFALGEDPKTYTFVATTDGYLPQCFELSIEENRPDTDFALSPALMAAVTGEVTGTVAPMSDTPLVHIGFKPASCPVETAFTGTTDDEDDTTAEIYYTSATGEFRYEYEISLPAGTYDVVASTEGLNDMEESNVAVSDGTTVDIDFDK